MIESRECSTGTITALTLLALSAVLSAAAQSKDGMVEFQGYVSAPIAMLVSYRLTILRIGDGGTSSTAQSGHVQISIPNERTRLSLTAMNVGSRDHYEAELTVWGPSGEVVRVKLEQLPRI